LFHVEFGLDVGFLSILVLNKDKILDNDVNVLSFFLDLFVYAGFALGSFHIVFRFCLLVFTCAKDFNQVVEFLGRLEAVYNDEAIV